MFLFTKMQATGNDFIILNYIEDRLEYSYKLLSNFLCDRHFGIGADGILILEKSDIAEYKMRIFNKDGTEAKMCGNGIRCLAKYIYERELTDKDEIYIETLSGVKNVKLNIEGSTVVSVRVDMGEANFQKSKMPMIYAENAEKFVACGLEIYPISVGNPHCVCFVEDIKDFDTKKYGPQIENAKYFPNRTNVDFVQIEDKNNISVKVWERGVGETLSCGTGACASAIIAHKYENLDSKISVKLLGGKLEVECIDNKMILEGPAEFVFDGKIEI